MNLSQKILKQAEVDPGVTALCLIDRCRELETQLAERKREVERLIAVNEDVRATAWDKGFASGNWKKI